MASHDENNTSTRPPKAAAPPRTSQKLNRTLKELETAFSDWEALGISIADNPAGVPTAKAPTPPAESANEQEFRSRTKKLLSQLRDQLDELND